RSETIQVNPPNATCLKNSIYYGVGLSVLSVLKVAPHVALGGDIKDNYVTFKVGDIIEARLSNFGGDFLHKNEFGFYPAWADLNVKLFPLDVAIAKIGGFQAKFSTNGVIDPQADATGSLA